MGLAVINWDGRILGRCRNFWKEFGGNAFKDALPAALICEVRRYAAECSWSAPRRGRHCLHHVRDLSLAPEQRSLHLSPKQEAIATLIARLSQRGGVTGKPMGEPRHRHTA